MTVPADKVAAAAYKKAKLQALTVADVGALELVFCRYGRVYRIYYL